MSSIGEGPEQHGEETEDTAETHRPRSFLIEVAALLTGAAALIKVIAGLTSSPIIAAAGAVARALSDLLSARSRAGQILVTGVVVATAGAAAAFAMGQLIPRDTAPPHVGPPSSTSGPGTPPAINTTTAGTSGSAQVVPLNTAPPAKLRTCPGIPGADAEPFAADLLRRLYLGPQVPNADPTPGDDVGGCVGQTYTSRDHGDQFAYVLGTDHENTLKSIAVVSKMFGAAIFLAPAAEQVRKWIATRYPDIGGWPRTNVGPGDYYGVKTMDGTAILMRTTKYYRGHERAYLAMLPPTALLWREMMSRHGTWLFARPGGRSNGKRRIRLVTSLQTDETVEAIIVDSSDGGAHIAGEPGFVRRAGAQMDQKEVSNRARQAPQ